MATHLFFDILFLMPIYLTLFSYGREYHRGTLSACIYFNLLSKCLPYRTIPYHLRHWMIIALVFFLWFIVVYFLTRYHAIAGQLYSLRSHRISSKFVRNCKRIVHTKLGFLLNLRSWSALGHVKQSEQAYRLALCHCSPKILHPHHAFLGTLHATLRLD